MKSKWLPTFPLHAANWLADPRVQMLDPEAKSILLESLLRSWMLGRAIPVPDSIADAYGELWPEYEVVLHEHEKLHQQRAEWGRRGNEKRWGSPTDSPPDSLPDSLGESPPESPRDRTPSPTPTITQSRTKTRTEKSSPAEPALLPDPPEASLPAKRSRPTWITRYAEAYRELTGGEMPIEPSLRPLAKLRAEHGDDAVYPAWRRCLEESDLKYLSAASFAAKFGYWAGTARQRSPARQMHRNDLAELEYLRRRGAADDDDPFAVEGDGA